MKISLNLESIRSGVHGFKTGVARAAQIGFRYVEPTVLDGSRLAREPGLFHSFSIHDDPHEIKDILDARFVRTSAVSAQCRLTRPEVTIPYLETAIRFASVLDARLAVTDEGLRPGWGTAEDAWALMRYTLSRVLRTAERHRVYVAIEPSHSVCSTPAALQRMATIVESPMLRIKYDPANALMNGKDPYEHLEAVADYVGHFHARDISGAYAAVGSRATGGILGCACGKGLMDWSRVLRILHRASYQGALSITCGTPEEAAVSLEHMSHVVADTSLGIN
jgi:sugar phosphate isomerase/epimerase